MVVGWGGGVEGLGRMGLLFEIDKMLFVSLGGIKITPGCSEWEPNVFTLGVVWKEERAVLLCGRMIPCATPKKSLPRSLSYVYWLTF